MSLGLMLQNIASHNLHECEMLDAICALLLHPSCFAEMSLKQNDMRAFLDKE
jgi:hypothetical protein